MWEEERQDPLPTPCTFASAVSHGDHLLVISPLFNNKAYVYNGHHWASEQHLSQLLYTIRSTIFNGHLYLMGGEGKSASITREVCLFRLPRLAHSQLSTQ